MNQTSSNLEVKHINRIRAAKHLLDQGGASRQELASALGLSLPTLSQIVNDLLEIGLICESGEYGSTGGRKAKVLTIREGAFCVAGVEISKNHVQLVLMDLTQKKLDSERINLRYENTPSYYAGFGKIINDFLQRNGIGVANPSRLLGVGFSLPGTMKLDNGLLMQSLTLGDSEINLTKFSQTIPYPTCFGQNAKNAVLAEVDDKQKNTIYISLSETVGGGAYICGNIYSGNNFKAVLFGHMIVVPNGKKCYCGKRGCLNTYCSTQVLSEDVNQTLEQFFDALSRGNTENAKVWDTYLDYLSLAIANLRTIFDCDIIIGGDISVYLEKYMDTLEEKVMRNIIFEYDMSFIHLGKYKREVFAVGAARLMVDKSIQESDLLLP